MLQGAIATVGAKVRLTPPVKPPVCPLNIGVVSGALGVFAAPRARNFFGVIYRGKL